MNTIKESGEKKVGSYYKGSVTHHISESAPVLYACPLSDEKINNKHDFQCKPKRLWL